MIKCAVLTVSDRCCRNESKDESGQVIKKLVKDIGWEVLGYDIVPDEADLIKEKLCDFCDNLRADVVFTTGGTGLGPRDVTPEATKEVSHKKSFFVYRQNHSRSVPFAPLRYGLFEHFMWKP